MAEVVSPGDESWEKLPFYAEHGVDEVVIVDPADRSVAWLARAGARYKRVEHSTLLDVDVAASNDWPT